MNLEVMANIIQTAGHGVIGQSIFINFIPQDVSGLLLRDHFGGTKLDHELPGYIKAPFFLIARGKDYVAMKTLLENAVKAIEDVGKAKATVMGVKFNYARPRNKPFPYSSSPGQNWELNVTIDCCYVDAA